MSCPVIPKDLSKVSLLKRKELYRKQLLWVKKCEVKEKEATTHYIEWQHSHPRDEPYKGTLKMDSIKLLGAEEWLEYIRLSLPITCRPTLRPYK